MSDLEIAGRERIPEYLEIGIGLVDRRDREMRALMPSELFHYTRFEGVQGILESNTVWATNILHVNDASELKYGHDLLKAVAGDLRPSDGPSRAFLKALIEVSDPFTLGLDYYVSSFCEKDDLLSQWRAYAGPDGYSLAFNGQDFTIAATKEEVEHFTSSGIYRVEYDPRVASTEIRRFLDVFLERIRENIGQGKDGTIEVLAGVSAAFGSLVTLLLGVKHPTFSEEAEWRLVIVVDHDEAVPIVKHRTTAAGEVPYIPVRLRRGDDPYGILPVSRVVAGPKVKEPDDLERVKALLTRTNHTGVSIERSIIPLV